MENFSNETTTEVENQKRKLIRKFPDSQDIDIPTFTPNLTPSEYMRSVMGRLNLLGEKSWADKTFPLWLHDKLIDQNLFRRAEFAPSQDRKRPDPCTVKKLGPKQGFEYNRQFLHCFQDDIDTENVCIELRKFLRYIHQKLGKTRLLNLQTGYHSVVTKRSKTQIDLDTYIIATPLQLDINPDIQTYVRNFMPNKMITLHFGTQIPGLDPIQPQSDKTLVAPIDVPNISIKPVENETDEETRAKDAFNRLEE